MVPESKPRELLYVPQRDSVKLNLISRMCCAKRITEVAVALGRDFPKWLLARVAVVWVTVVQVAVVLILTKSVVLKLS